MHIRFLPRICAAAHVLGLGSVFTAGTCLLLFLTDRCHLPACLSCPVQVACLLGYVQLLTYWVYAEYLEYRRQFKLKS